MVMHIFDFLFTLLHLVIIGFNLLGWIWRRTRKFHFIVVLLTAGSWFILGVWYGLGYCPITDWQWQLKERMGETNLPNSFIKYYVDNLSGRDISSDFIDAMTAIGFAVAAVLSVYLNFFKRNKIGNKR